MNRRLSRLFLLCALTTASALPLAVGQQPDAPPEAREARRKEDAQQRRESLRKICDHLGVGKDCVIADIGAGNGRNAWTFADIVDEGRELIAPILEHTSCSICPFWKLVFPEISESRSLPA